MVAAILKSQWPFVTPQNFDGGPSRTAAQNSTALASALATGLPIMLPPANDPYMLSAPLVVSDGANIEGTHDSVLKIADGVNSHVIASVNFATLTGTGNAGGSAKVRLKGFAVDGNEAGAGNSSGHGVALYGRDMFVEDLLIRDVSENGLHTEYASAGAGTSPYAGRIAHIDINGAGKHGWYNKVSDLHANDINVRAAGKSAVSTYDGIHLAAGGSVRGSNLNVWSSEATNFMRYAMHILAEGCTIWGGHLEAGGLANLYEAALYNMLAGFMLYNSHGAPNAIWAGNFGSLDASIKPGPDFSLGLIALQLGDSGASKAATGNHIRFRASSTNTRVLDISSSGGANNIDMRSNVTGATHVNGPTHSTDEISGWAATMNEDYRKEPSRPVQIAAGSTTSDATFLVSANTTVTSDNDAKGVKMPTVWAQQGFRGTVINDGTNICKVYPHSGGNFQGLAVDVAVSLAVDKMLTFRRSVQGGWAYSVSSVS